jgi:hypothetical protein
MTSTNLTHEEKVEAFRYYAPRTKAQSILFDHLMDYASTSDCIYWKRNDLLRELESIESYGMYSSEAVARVCGNSHQVKHLIANGGVSVSVTLDELMRDVEAYFTEYIARQEGMA